MSFDPPCATMAGESNRLSGVCSELELLAEELTYLAKARDRVGAGVLKLYRHVLYTSVEPSRSGAPADRTVEAPFGASFPELSLSFSSLPQPSTKCDPKTPSSARSRMGDLDSVRHGQLQLPCGSMDRSCSPSFDSSSAASSPVLSPSVGGALSTWLGIPMHLFSPATSPWDHRSPATSRNSSPMQSGRSPSRGQASFRASPPRSPRSPRLWPPHGRKVAFGGGVATAVPAACDGAADQPFGEVHLRPRAKTADSPTTSNVTDAWAAEVLSRLQARVQNMQRDPRELFRRFRSDSSHDLCDDVWHAEDMYRLVRTFEPDVEPSQLDRIWRALNKEEGDVFTLDEFRQLCGPRAPPVPFAGLGADWGLELGVGHSRSLNAEERRNRRLLGHRLGRAVGRLTADMRHQLHQLTLQSHAMARQDFVGVCESFALALSQEEALRLFQLTSKGNAATTVNSRVFERLFRASVSGAPPEEIPWAEETLMAAGIAARSDGGDPLAVSLARLGGADDAAEAADVRKVLGRHLFLLEENRWETLLIALDKRFDGRLLLEPLAQWAAGIGVAENVEVLDMNRLPALDPDAMSSGSGGSCSLEKDEIAIRRLSHLLSG